MKNQNWLFLNTAFVAKCTIEDMMLDKIRIGFSSVHAYC